MRTHSIVQRLRSSKLATRVISGAFWSLVGAVGGKGLTLISSIIVARIIGKEHFGELGIVQNTVGAFAIFAGAGLSLTTTKFTAELRDVDRARLGRILALNTRITYWTAAVTTLIILVFADQIASRTLAAPHLAPEVRIAAFLLLLGSINGVQVGALSGFEAFRQSAKITFISGLCTAILSILGVVTLSVQGALLGMVGGLVVSYLLCRYSLNAEHLKRGIILSVRGSSIEWSNIWRFTLPSMLSSLSVLPFNWACNIILVNQDHGYLEMGILNAAIQWRNIILFVPSVLISVCLPMLSNLRATGKLESQNKVLFANIGLAAILGLAAALAASLLSGPILAAYGQEFAAGRTTLCLQAFAAALAAVSGVIGQYFISSSAIWLLIVLQCAWGTINVLLTWIMRHQGAEGVSTAYLLSYIVHLVLTGYFLRRLIKANALEQKSC